MYVENNPVKYIDPDGKEKLIFFNKDIAKLKFEFTLIVGSVMTKTDNNIHIFAHGNPYAITPIVDNVKERIIDGKTMDEFLTKHSEVWRNRKKDEIITIVLHSCRTGKSIEGKESVAEKIANELGNVRIIAPDERVYFGMFGEIGPYKAKNQDANGEYTKGEKSMSDVRGNWNVFGVKNDNTPTKIDFRYYLFEIPKDEN